MATEAKKSELKRATGNFKSPEVRPDYEPAIPLEKKTGEKFTTRE